MPRQAIDAPHANEVDASSPPCALNPPLYEAPVYVLACTMLDGGFTTGSSGFVRRLAYVFPGLTVRSRLCEWETAWLASKGAGGATRHGGTEMMHQLGSPGARGERQRVTVQEPG